MAEASGLLNIYDENIVQAKMAEGFGNPIVLDDEAPDFLDSNETVRTNLELGTKTHAKDEWNYPDWSIIDDRRGELPEFPIDALAAPWQTWVERAAHGAGATPAHVAVPLLAIASSLIGTVRRVEVSRSWSQPMTMWAAVVGFSGTSKDARH
jgi:hypothetical protein